jgi:ribosomal protein L36
MSPVKKLYKNIKLIRRDFAEQIKNSSQQRPRRNIDNTSTKWASDDAGKQSFFSAMSPAKKLDEYIKLIRRDVAERIKNSSQLCPRRNIDNTGAKWASDDEEKQKNIFLRNVTCQETR